MDPNGNTKNIPEEILFDILTLLPVKSLCRFRCVSKQWFSIISDPDFVAAHLSRSKSRPKLLFSVATVYDCDNYNTSFYSVEYPELEDQRSPGRLHATINPMDFWDMPKGISSSASGLICYKCDQGIKIGNPITGEFNLIHYDSELVRCYLGFDPIEKRDVVLQLDSQFNMKTKKNRLFSVSESRWHDIPPPPQPFFSIAQSAICINGVIYFAAIDNSCKMWLYAFDVRLKCFDEVIQWPHGRSVPPVIEYKDRVALLEDGVSYKLWILDDPKKHTWSCKSFEVPWPRGDNNDWRLRSMLCGATHRGELMFVTDLSTEGSLQLFLFEIDTNTLRMFQVDGFALKRFDNRSVQLKFLIESLHSPNKSN